MAVADENQGFGMYREYLINELTNRARRVSLNFKVQDFQHSFELKAFQ